MPCVPSSAMWWVRSRIINTTREVYSTVQRTLRIRKILALDRVRTLDLECDRMRDDDECACVYVCVISPRNDASAEESLNL